MGESETPPVEPKPDPALPFEKCPGNSATPDPWRENLIPPEDPKLRDSILQAWQDWAKRFLQGRQFGSVSPSDREDIAAEAILRMWQEAENRRLREQPRGWLFRTIWNLVYDHL